MVCVGNLQVGGSGKTPITRFVARTLLEMGRQVVVSCSGYGSPHAEAASLAPGGELRPREWGDEPAMLRWLEPQLPLVVGGDRVAAARIVHDAMPDAVLVLDDGFQHLPLRKHLTLLLDPEEPDNASCLPAGPYREPRGNRRRADLVVPGRFHIERSPLRLIDPAGIEVVPDAYSVLCALGQPQGFLNDLADGFSNAQKEFEPRLLPDHDPLEAGTLFGGFPPDLPLVVTAKDWVKLRERSDVSQRTILIATYDLRLEPFEEFRSFLQGRLAESG